MSCVLHNSVALAPRLFVFRFYYCKIPLVLINCYKKASVLRTKLTETKYRLLKEHG
jgi:hypothetical protein